MNTSVRIYNSSTSFISLISSDWVPTERLTSLQVHQENVTAFRPTKVTTCNIAVDKPSIVNALESRLHLHAKCLVDLFVFRNGITNRFQSKEAQNPPNFVEAVQFGDHIALEVFQSRVGAGFIYLANLLHRDSARHRQLCRQLEVTFPDGWC
jgi:hypothetical protein